MSSEKTEQPTAKRLADARRKGDVPKSKDLGTFATWLLATGGLLALGGAMEGRLEGHLARTLARVARVEDVAPGAAMHEALSTFVATVVPFLALVAGGGALVAFLEVGAVFAPSRVAPDLGRVDVVKGFGRLFTKDRFVDVAKACVVIAAVAAVLVVRVRDAVPALATLPGRSPAVVLAAAADLFASIGLRVAAVLAAVALLDVFVQRRRHLAQLRMTKDEIKREHKESEGDGHQKGERARLHREILEHQTLESVRKADVLVVNPTHLAIALRFDEASEQEAPEIVAKGEDHLARRMIEVARQEGVPVVRDVPLARALYALEEGTEIPEVLYEAVAAVLRAAWAERDAT